MNFLVDSNVVSEAMKKTPETAVMSWLEQNHERCFLSSITIAELELGIELLPAGQKRERLQEALRQFLPLLEERVLPFDILVARQWAKLWAKLERDGRKTPLLDSMIEATAIHWDLKIATRNVGDFVQAGTLSPWAT